MNDKVPKYSVGTLTYTKAGLFMLFGWLLWGDFCFTLFETIGGPNILGLYLQDNFRVSNLQVALIFSFIPNLIGVVVGPILSFKSDRYRSRRGRRIPFILWTTPFLCCFAAGIGYADDIIAFIKLHASADGLLSPFTLAMILISILVIGFSFFNEFVNTVYWYLFADVVPEKFLGRFMGLFRLVGAGAGFLINVTLAEHMLSHMRIIHIGVSALYFVGFSLMCLRVREGEYPPVTDVTEKTSRMEQVKLYFRECFSHRIFILLYLSTMAFVIARALPGAGIFTLHLSQHVASSQVDTGPVAAMAMSRDGQRILTASASGVITLSSATPRRLPAPFWDAVRRAELPADRILAAHGPAALSAVLAPDGRWGAVGDAEGGIRIWTLSGNNPVATFAGHTGPVMALACSPDGSRLASGGADKTVRIWDVDSRRCLATLGDHGGEVRAVAFASDGKRLASGGLDGVVRIFEAGSSALVRAIPVPHGKTVNDKGVETEDSRPTPVYALSFASELAKVPASPAPRPTGIGPVDVAVNYLRDVFTNESLFDHPAEQRSRVVIEDGWIVGGGQEAGDDSRNALLRIWSVASGELQHELKGHKQAITSIKYKPDLHLLLSGSLDRTARIWNPAAISATATDQSLQSLSGYTVAVTALDVQAAGKHVVTASRAGTLHLWNMDAGISLRKAGIAASFFGIISLLLAYPLGALVDRFHPVRITVLASILVLPCPFLTYALVHDYQTNVYIEMFKVPIFALISAAGMPLLISLLPRDKFGQMCSANGLTKQFSQMTLTVFGAMVLDWVTQKTFLTDNYRYGSLWTGVGFVVQAAIFVLIYREWQRLGGDKGYKVPEANEAGKP